MKALLMHVACVLLAAAAGSAVGADPREGQDYLVLDPPRSERSGGQIEVIEFFYYGCPVCYESQPYIAQWLAASGADVALRRVPAPGENDESFALTFFALEATGNLARLHWPVYENHHFDDRRLHEEKNLFEWLASNGVDAERFREARSSPEIRARIADARELLNTYGVRGVPSFAVDGRYLTSARLAGGVKEMMDVVEYLVGLARKH